MTKAIEALERLWKEAKINPYAGELRNRSDYNIIKHELERGIPRRPYVHDEYSYPECPDCGYELQAYYNETLKRHVGDNYCPECGIPLDWKESEHDKSRKSKA